MQALQILVDGTVVDRQRDLNSGEKEGSPDKDWCRIAFSRGKRVDVVDKFLVIAFFVLGWLFVFLGFDGPIESLSGGIGFALVSICFLVGFGGAVRLLFFDTSSVAKRQVANVVFLSLLFVSGLFVILGFPIWGAVLLFAICWVWSFRN